MEFRNGRNVRQSSKIQKTEKKGKPARRPAAEEPRKENKVRKGKPGREEVPEKFPNFMALSEEEKVAFFQALVAARQNVEKSGVVAGEGFGTVHDAYVEYMRQGGDASGDEADGKSSLSVFSLPEEESEVYSSLTVSDASAAEPPEEWEADLKKDAERIVNLYLSKKTKENKAEAAAPAVEARPLGDAGVRRKEATAHRAKASAAAEPSTAEPSTAEPLGLSGMKTPHFDALAPEEREVFFNILREAHKAVVEENPGQRDNISSLETIMKSYRDEQEASPERQRNLRVKVTLTSADNQRLEDQEKKAGSRLSVAKDSLETLAGKELHPSDNEEHPSKIQIVKKHKEPQKEESTEAAECQPSESMLSLTRRKTLVSVKESEKRGEEEKREGAGAKEVKKEVEGKKGEENKNEQEAKHKHKGRHAHKEEEKREHKEEEKREHKEEEEHAHKEEEEHEHKEEEEHAHKEEEEHEHKEEDKHEHKEEEKHEHKEVEKHKPKEEKHKHKEEKHKHKDDKHKHTEEEKHKHKEEEKHKDEAEHQEEEEEEPEEIEEVRKESKCEKIRRKYEEKQRKEEEKEEERRRKEEEKEEERRRKRQKQLEEKKRKERIRQKKKEEEEACKKLKKQIKEEEEDCKKLKKQLKEEQKELKRMKELEKCDPCVLQRRDGCRSVVGLLETRPGTPSQEDLENDARRGDRRGKSLSSVYTLTSKGTASTLDESRGTVSRSSSLRTDKEDERQDEESESREEDEGESCGSLRREGKAETSVTGCSVDTQPSEESRVTEEKAEQEGRPAVPEVKVAAGEEPLPRRKEAAPEAKTAREEQTKEAAPGGKAPPAEEPREVTRKAKTASEEETRSTGESKARRKVVPVQSVSLDMKRGGSLPEGMSLREVAPPEQTAPARGESHHSTPPLRCAPRLSVHSGKADKDEEESELVYEVNVGKDVGKDVGKSTVPGGVLEPEAGRSGQKPRRSASTPEETAARKCSSKTQEQDAGDAQVVPKFRTGKVVLVDDDVIDKVRHLIQDLERKAQAKDVVAGSEYMKLLLGYVDYLSTELESMLTRRRDRRCLVDTDQVQAAVTAAEVRLKFRDKRKMSEDNDKYHAARSISEENARAGMDADVGKAVKASRKSKSEEKPPAVEDITPASDSDSSVSSEEIMEAPMAVKETRPPYTKVRLLQDLLKDRAKFEEGSTDELKIVHVPQEELPPEKVHQRTVELREDEDDAKEIANRFKILKNIAKFCWCGKKEAEEEETILENLKGEAVQVDLSHKQKRDAASATLNESTMDVLKAAERRRIIQKHWKRSM